MKVMLGLRCSSRKGRVCDSGRALTSIRPEGAVEGLVAAAGADGFPGHSAARQQDIEPERQRQQELDPFNLRSTGLYSALDCQ